MCGGALTYRGDTSTTCSSKPGPLMLQQLHTTVSSSPLQIEITQVIRIHSGGSRGLVGIV